MDNIVHFQPAMTFSYRRPFEIKDGYNGPRRGTWWYRSKVTGYVIGPYFHEHAATLAQQTEDMANGYL